MKQKITRLASAKPRQEGINDMALVKIKKNYQITLPKNLRQQVNVAEGDYMDIKLNEKGVLTIRPVKLIDSDQAYFHTKEWQKHEAEADKDIASGNVVGPFDNIKDALNGLKNAEI